MLHPVYRRHERQRRDPSHPRQALKPLDPFIPRVVIGQPDYVPAGGYAKSALEGAGLCDKLKPKLVHGENVRQVLAYVERGEVDAAFVYGTDARTPRSPVRSSSSSRARRSAPYARTASGQRRAPRG